MTIKAELADGTPLEFPDGTDPAIIQATVKRLIGERNAANVSGAGSNVEVQAGLGPSGRVRDPSSGGGAEGDLTPMGSIRGAADIADVGLQNIASSAFQGLAGIGGALQGADPVASMEQGKAIISEGEMGEDATNLIQQGQSVYDSLPDGAKNVLSNIVNAGEISAETVFEATGSPFLATMTRIIPDAIGLIAGTKALGKGVSTAVDAIPGQGQQTKGMQNIAARLEAGDTSGELAKYTLEAPKTGQAMLSAEESAGKLMAPKKGSFALVKSGTPRAKIDTRAKQALNKGWDAGIISGIEQVSPLDRRKMSGMLNIMEKVKKDPMGTDVWPANIIGHSINARLDPLFQQNKDAAKRLSKEANRLKGRSIDYEPIEQNLMEGLDKLGINYDRNSKALSFEGSNIEMNPAAERQVKTFINRLLRVGNDDALAAHNLKKWIDTQVEYGKTAKDPMVNSVKQLMKSTRRDVNESLRALSPEYKNANVQWADTKKAIDALDELTGTRTNLERGDTSEALGLLSRKLITNYSSGVDLRKALELMEDTAVNYGAEFKDSISAQVKFNEELNRVLGAAKRGSLQGQTEQGVSKGIIRSIGSAVVGAPAAGTKAGVRKIKESTGRLEKGELDDQINALRAYLESK